MILTTTTKVPNYKFQQLTNGVKNWEIIINEGSFSELQGDPESSATEKVRWLEWTNTHGYLDPQEEIEIEVRVMSASLILLFSGGIYSK